MHQYVSLLDCCTHLPAFQLPDSLAAPKVLSSDALCSSQQQQQQQQQHGMLPACCNGVIRCAMQGSCRPRVQQAAQQQRSECKSEVSGGLVGS